MTLKASLGELAGLVRPKTRRPSKKRRPKILLRVTNSREKELLLEVARLGYENIRLRKRLGEKELSIQEQGKLRQQARYARNLATGCCLRCDDPLPRLWGFAICRTCREKKNQYANALYRSKQRQCAGGCGNASSTGWCRSCKAKVRWNQWRIAHSSRACRNVGCARAGPYIKGLCRYHYNKQLKERLQ